MVAELSFAFKQTIRSTAGSRSGVTPPGQRIMMAEGYSTSPNTTEILKCCPSPVAVQHHAQDSELYDLVTTVYSGIFG